MPSFSKSLFSLRVDEAKLNETYRQLKDNPGWECARLMLDDVFQEFDDPEGNFLEQFQTTGFNARYFELYLFAYFSRSGFHVNRANVNPDFIVTRNRLRVAIEATTLNPSQSGVLLEHGVDIENSPLDGLKTYQVDEMPIRFGGTLLSKLQKKYWELPHCKGLPLVIAVEAFNNPHSLHFSDVSLSQYAYGLKQTASWTDEASLRIQTEVVEQHNLASKVIPSKFFGQPDTENISAILFTNSGSNGKFARMGYQTGYGTDKVGITRTGFCHNPDPDAMDPTFFSYSMDFAPLVESWGEGMVILHNPDCLYPIPKDFFVDAVQTYIEKGQIKSDYLGWHPFTSQTRIFNLGESKRDIYNHFPIPHRIAIHAIHRDRFRQICGFYLDTNNPIIEENGWFTDESEGFLGVVLRDKVDRDWGWVILARDQMQQFRAIDNNASIESRIDALVELNGKMTELLHEPKRIFPQ